MKKNPFTTKNNLLKTLIVLGIIAIICSLYVQYVKPYVKELSLEKQDQLRIKDLDSLNGAMQEMVSASSTGFIGKNKTIYISIPSDDSRCSNLDLPSVPDGWQYHCVATTTLSKTDGSGWVPVNLSEKINQLPIDPINKPETLNYYAYVASSTNQYVFVGALDSKRFLKGKAKNDGGIDNIRHEIGSNISLWSTAQGIVGYWPLKKEDGFILHNYFKNHPNGEIIGKPYWNELDNSLKLDGNNFVYVDQFPEMNSIGMVNTGFTIVLSIKDTENINQSITEKWVDSTSYPWAIRIENDNLIFAEYDGQNWSGASTPIVNIKKNTWSKVTCVRDVKNKRLNVYINNILVTSQEDGITSNTSNFKGFTIGSRNRSGDLKAKTDIKDFYVLNRPLQQRDLISFGEN